jgi:F-type H+-transporting ATPase subunit alpha
LDKFPTDVVAKYEAGLYPFVEERYPQIFSKLEEAQDITEEIEGLLKTALEAYNEEFKDTIK